MVEDREPGYYWVRRHDEYGGEWIIAQWSRHPMSPYADSDFAWWNMADELSGDDADYAEIGERIPDHG